jgi:hypothetical protein
VFFISQLWGAIDRFRLRRMTPAQTAATLYTRLTQRTSRLLVSCDTGDTPYELARAMHAYFAPDVITPPPWMEDIHTIVNLYVKAAYSPHAPNKTEQRNAIQRWGRLQWWLWRAKWFMPVDSLLRSLARTQARLRLNKSKIVSITKE